MIFITAAVRAAMCRHQGVRTPPAGLPMWRLLGGEVLWAVGQLLARPWVLVAFLAGFVGSLLVLGANAPGPVAEPQWRVIISVAVGWVLGMGGRFVPMLSGPAPAGQQPTTEARPMTAVTVVASTVVAATLVVWLLVWLLTLLT